MKKYIAVVAALAAVSFVFWGNLPLGGLNYSENENSPKKNSGLTLPSLSFSLPGLNFPGINTAPIGEEAYQTFELYLRYAGEKNLEALAGVSHQLSPACEDPLRSAECERLMEGVYSLRDIFKKDDFNHVYFDERQIVMFTDYLVIPGSSPEEPRSRIILLFTRTKAGEPKLLGIQFCAEDPDSTSECVEADPAKRDLNGNGWWDNVESLFR